MPVHFLGQMISFAVEVDDDERFRKWVWAGTRPNDTVARIVARLGHPEDARRVCQMNKIHSARTVLHHHPRRRHDRSRIKVPGNAAPGLEFHVLAGDTPPRPTSGYAKFEVKDRPEQVGVTTFTGYDPLVMEVPIRFEAMHKGGLNGYDMERDIAKLERMAGRGHFVGAAVGPPPVVRVSTTGGAGEIVPLIPLNYQWSAQNPHAPLWRIAGLEWDDGAIRDHLGNRIRQLATVTLQQHTRLNLLQRSVSHRARVGGRVISGSYKPVKPGARSS